MTMTVKLKGLPVAELGTPLMMPLDASNIRPGGNDPEFRTQLL